MVNMCVKLYKIFLNCKDVMDTVKIFYDIDNYNADAGVPSTACILSINLGGLVVEPLPAVREVESSNQA